MQQRLAGLETEFSLRYSDATSPTRRPTNKLICQTILDAVEQIVKTAPGEFYGEPNFQRFVQNGGAFSCEMNWSGEIGFLECATPECRGPSQLVLYQKAQEAIIQRALPLARVRLLLGGWPGEIAVVKNCRDAEGHIYGTQENYEAQIAHGWHLFLYRAGLVLLLPFVLLSAAMLVALVLLVVLVLFMFPLAQHWFGLDSYSSSPSVNSHVQIDPAPAWISTSRAGLCMLTSLFWPIAFVFMVLLRTVAFREIRRSTTAFLISRVVMTGAGTLHDDGSFGLSERADSVSTSMRCTLRRRPRSIFEIANLLKPLILSSGTIVTPLLALFSRRQRLQLGLSDSNCAQTAEYLKIGATSLVLDMAEAGFLDDAPRVVRPADALKCFSNDPTLRNRVPLRSGDRMNALELQRWYLRRAEQYISANRVASLECGEVVALWRATLNGLERDPSSLVGRIDWVTKQALITGVGNLSSAAKKKIDIKYHEVGSGYFSLLERRGLAPVRVSQAAISAAVLYPPENTPAWKRGHLVRDAGIAPSQVSWRIRPGGQRRCP